MKRKLQLISLSILCLCFSACGSKEKKLVEPHKEGQIPIVISLTDEKATRVDNYFKYHSFIALEAAPESIIKNINKVYFTNDEILILDIYQNTVFIFDSGGTYLRKINKQGRGPDEYLKADDIYYDSSSKHIFLLDGLSGNIVEYELNGNFISKNKITKGHSFIKVPESGEWLVYRGNASADYEDEKSYHNLFIYNKKYELLKEDLPFSTYLLGRNYSYGHIKSIFSIHDDEIHILPALSNVVYTYDSENQTLNPKYELIFEKQTNWYQRENMHKKDIEDLLKKMKNGDNPGYISHFHKIENMIFFNFYHKNKKGHLMCFYNIDTQQTEIADFIFDNNGLFFTPASYSSINDKNLILSIVNGALMNISIEKNGGNPIIKDIAEKIIDGEDANPVLVFYKLHNDETLH